MTQSADELRNQYGIWGSHPDYPVGTWKDEVAADETRQGYWAWVAKMLAMDADQDDSSKPTPGGGS